MEPEKIREFLDSLAIWDVEDDKWVESSITFFSDNLEKMDSEFVASLLREKKKGAGSLVGVMKEYAYKGSPAAQVAIGALMLEGKGIEKNTHEAVFWLKRACIGKNPNAGLLLSNVYANGLGVRESLIKARQYMQASADLGVSRAQYHYAMMLLDQEWGPVDEEEALRYMKIAAHNDYAQAIDFLKENGLFGLGD
jgi:hypothetical protein